MSESPFAEGNPPFDPAGTFRQMPPGTPFNQADINEIRDWIARGCPNKYQGDSNDCLS